MRPISRRCRREFCNALQIIPYRFGIESATNDPATAALAALVAVETPPLPPPERAGFPALSPLRESTMAGNGNAARADRRVPATVRSRLEDHLRRASEQLDDVQREVTQGIRDVRHFDELEEKFDRACATGRCGFRGSSR